MIFWVNSIIFLLLILLLILVKSVRISNGRKISAGYNSFFDLFDQIELLKTNGSTGDVLVAHGRWNRKFLQFVKKEGDKIIFDVPLLHATSADEAAFLKICEKHGHQYEVISDERGRILQIVLDEPINRFLCPFTSYLCFETDEIFHIEILPVY